MQPRVTPMMSIMSVHENRLGQVRLLGPGLQGGVFGQQGREAKGRRLLGYEPEELIGQSAYHFIHPDDVAARGNFCTVNEAGVITDRRAGRIANEVSRELVCRLRTIKIEGVEIFIETIKEHRFAFIMRGKGLGHALSETDPLKTGVAPMPVRALDPVSDRSACMANHFVGQARELLAADPQVSIKDPTFVQYKGRWHLFATARAQSGKVEMNGKSIKTAPLSSMTKAREIANLLKTWILQKEFQLTEPVQMFPKQSGVKSLQIR